MTDNQIRSILKNCTVIKQYCLLQKIIFLFVLTFSSCKNQTGNFQQPPVVALQPPSVHPLALSKAKKIDWAAIKPTTVKLVTTKLDWDKLPVEFYDSSGFKPFKFPVEESKLDINALPEKDFDIDKLKAKPFKFKITALPPPKFIRVGSAVIQDPVIRRYLLHGLPGKSRTAILYDRDGFLWIATAHGLYRYDGESLSQYLYWENANEYYTMLQSSDGEIWISDQQNGIRILDLKNGILKSISAGNGLSSNRIFGLFQDNQQRVWVNNLNGVDIIDIHKLTTKLLDNVNGLSTNEASFQTIQDKQNNIWITTYLKGLDIIDLNNKKIRYLNKAHGLKSDSTLSLCYDRNGKIWIGSEGGVINVINGKRTSIQRIKELQSHGTDISDIIQDRQGRIWVSTFDNVLKIIDDDKHAVKAFEYFNGSKTDGINNMIEDGEGQIWLSTFNGLNLFCNPPNIKNTIGKDSVNGLTEDQRGLVWEATVSNGVNIIDYQHGTSKHLTEKNGLRSNSVSNFEIINKDMYIKTLNGISIVDSSAKTITNGLNIVNAGGVALDNSGRIWIGSNKGIAIYDPKTKTIKQLGKSQGLDDFFVDDIKMDRFGRMWISKNSTGVTVIDPKNWTIQYLINAPGLDKPTVKMLLQHNGNIWIGTNKGIYIADVSKQTLTSFAAPQGLISNRVETLLKHNGNIYAGTDQGITVIAPPDTHTGDNQKWLSSSTPVTQFYADNFQSDLITKSGMYWRGDIGITLMNFSLKDTSKAKALITGVNIMDQPKFFSDTHPSSLNGLSWDKVSGPENIPVNLELPYNQNFFQFSYSSLNLTPHDSTIYRYKLIGKDTAWSAVSVNNLSKNYYGLVPGNYTFEVITKTTGKAWSDPSVLSFTIKPPWWFTWWAWVLYILLAAGCLSTFANYRSRKLLVENQLLEEKIQARTNELTAANIGLKEQQEEILIQRNELSKTVSDLRSAQAQLIQSEKMASMGELTAGIAHEIQNPLNFVNNFSEVNKEMLDELDQELDSGNVQEAKTIAAEIRGNEEKINFHGKRADSIVKGMLEHSRTSKGEKTLTNINLLADEFLKLSYHGLRAKDKNFNADIKTDFGINLPKVDIVRQEIGRVLLNLFNNAFYAVKQRAKIAGPEYKPEVTVSTKAANGNFVIIVKDNGIGIPDDIKNKIMNPFFTTKPAGEGTGLGLSLSYDIVVKGHRGRIVVDSKIDDFTAFSVILPFG